MKTTSQIYCQFLVSSQINYTCTYLSGHFEGLDENSIYRFLKGNKLTPSIVWGKAKQSIILSKNGYVLFDDTVIDKDFSFKMDGVRKQYSGNAHKIIKGIGLVNCVYYNPEIDRHWVIDFRIFDPDKDGKTKIDLMKEMLNALETRNISYQTVLMDSWYATTEIMLLIGGKNKTFYCPIKINRLVDDSYGTQDYQSAGFLYWTKDELECGKLVKAKKFPMAKKLKLFRVSISTDRTELIVTNDLTRESAGDSQEEVAVRWKIEQFHREGKQVTGLGKCQCRTNRSQRNHICLCLKVWLFLNEAAYSNKQTIYQIKNNLLSNYMTKELKNPSLVYC